MSIAAAFLALVYAALACQREDDLIPIAIALLVALAVLAVVAMQLRHGREASRRNSDRMPTTAVRATRPANDNGVSE